MLSEDELNNRIYEILEKVRPRIEQLPHVPPNLRESFQSDLRDSIGTESILLLNAVVMNLTDDCLKHPAFAANIKRQNAFWNSGLREDAMKSRFDYSPKGDLPHAPTPVLPIASAVSAFVFAGIVLGFVNLFASMIAALFAGVFVFLFVRNKQTVRYRKECACFADQAVEDLREQLQTWILSVKNRFETGVTALEKTEI